MAGQRSASNQQHTRVSSPAPRPTVVLNIAFSATICTTLALSTAACAFRENGPEILQSDFIMKRTKATYVPNVGQKLYD